MHIPRLVTFNSLRRSQRRDVSKVTSAAAGAAEGAAETEGEERTTTEMDRRSDARRTEWICHDCSDVNSFGREHWNTRNSNSDSEQRLVSTYGGRKGLLQCRSNIKTAHFEAAEYSALHEGSLCLLRKGHNDKIPYTEWFSIQRHEMRSAISESCARELNRQWRMHGDEYVEVGSGSGRKYPQRGICFFEARFPGRKAVSTSGRR